MPFVLLLFFEGIADIFEMVNREQGVGIRRRGGSSGGRAVRGDEGQHRVHVPPAQGGAGGREEGLNYNEVELIVQNTILTTSQFLVKRK